MGKQQAIQQNELFQAEVYSMPDGYYSGDQPNPNLRAFVEAHLAEHPYDPEDDDYDVPAFNKPIETTKATAIYNMHTYWSKKPHDAIRQYILHYTQPGDLVLEPFSGSGGTAIAALLEGRKAVALDISPSASFITANSLHIFTCLDFEKAVSKLAQAVQPIVNSRFNFADPNGIIRAVVYTERFRCSRCFDVVPFISTTAGDKQYFRGRIKAKEKCPKCGEPLQTNLDERLGFVPAEIHVSPNNHPRKIVRINVLGDADIAQLFPVAPQNMPPYLQLKLEGNIQHRLWKNLAKAGAYCAGDLFSDSNLFMLLEIEEQIDQLKGISADSLSLLKLAVHSILYNCTRMYRHRIHTAGGGGFSGTYYIPHLSKCINPWFAFLDKCEEIKKAILEAQTTRLLAPILPVVVSCDSATEITHRGHVLPNSIDYIFTDPPYGGTFHYGALNFLWEAWRSCDLSWRAKEIIITEDGELTYLDWSKRMLAAMKEAFTVLKPGRWISLCFHGEVELWEAVNDIMAKAGFVPGKAEGALFIDTTQKSYNQLTGATAKKRDLVISFRKPFPNEMPFHVLLQDTKDSATFTEKVHVIIRDYLMAHPGTTKDRIYDEVVSRMVRSGQMEAHNFDALLHRIAEPASDDQTRWFLQHGDETKIDAAESAKEEKAAQTISSFVVRWLCEHPEQEGVHYSDIFEYYLYAVRDKPRRQLNDWLQDYFYATSAGTYRLPGTEEEKAAKVQGRQAGTNRHIKRFLAYIQQDLPIPAAERPSNATLVEWIRHCRRSNLYEQGRLLFEKGGLDLDQLGEEQQVEVEEDYQTCVRRIQVSMKEKKLKTLFDEVE